MRVGFGYDAHTFVDGRPLCLGGLRIPFEKGLLGHSDGDVLLHAISDAVLGAAGLEDIGFHFPNNDKSTEGIESVKILAHVMDLARRKGFTVVNVDAVVVCEEPKIQPHRESMCKAIARVMEVDPARINVKGKSTEGLGFAGQRQGIESYAVCILD